ncbi:MAG: DUF4330 family protein [Candidatus Omnitrophota bacterium]
MKILDEKGKLFGKINVIDFSVIFLLIFLLPISYFAYKVYTKEYKMWGESVEADFHCLFVMLEPEVAKSLSVGDAEFDKDGKPIAQIISLEEIKPYFYEIKLSEEEAITIKDSNLKQISAKLRLRAETRLDGNLYYKNSRLFSNPFFEFNTDKYTATFMFKQQGGLEERTLYLDITLKDLNENTLKLVCVGDKVLDRNGEVLAEILEIGKPQIGYININAKSGDFLIVQDEQIKQIPVKIRMRCQVDNNGNLYFEGKRVGRDTHFEFVTDKYKAKAILGIAYFEEKWLTLRIKCSGIIQEVANVAREGDIEKDNFGKTIGRIRSIFDVKTSTVAVAKFDGKEFAYVENPLYKDFILSVDVLALKKNEKYYYKDFPILIGNTITLNTSLYSVRGNIIDFAVKN